MLVQAATILMQCDPIVVSFSGSKRDIKSII
jgi:hypothetical protein